MAAGMILALTHGGHAMTDNEIPQVVTQDAVMAPTAEVAQMADWAQNVFCGTPVAQAEGQVQLVVRRQDHNVPRFGQSCMETPLRIGSQQFTHGLGTHANSEIAVTVPAGARSFEALVGVDVNDDTGGVRGSVRFSVEMDGAPVFTTDIVQGGQEPVAVSIPIPEGLAELVLKVDTTDDGPGFDQADWADARLVMADGSVRWLDEGQWDRLLQPGSVPFSFTYGGRPSAELLPTWERTVETRELEGKTEHGVTWTDPETGLAVVATVRTFAGYPAVDWVLSFENRGAADTPILEDVQALDTVVRTGNSKRAAVVHGLNGDVCGEPTFTPTVVNLEVGKSLHTAPAGGRPSNSAWPFYNLEYLDEGLLTAIGWSGQWASSIERTGAGPTRLRAGMERTHLLLHPGESIRTPRILVLAWKGDRLAAHNRFRRLLMFHYVPQVNGRPARLPVVSQCFDRYSWSVPAWATEAGQIDAVRATAEMGCDAHWLDAAWFPGGFPNGVGNWTTKPVEFPNGLGPVGEACHAAGLKFILWYEPERVAAGTEIATEHPEFVFGGANGGLFKLNDPEARRWLTDLLSREITEYGIDIYRNDFNIDPLGFWRANDTPDREGMTEIRYVEGHYEMWDELRARHPGLLIDNCASGGRRIDLESISRSVPLWRSDTSCSPGHPDWNQSQTYGLSLYIPLHTACGWTPEPYDFRSSATGGAISQFDYRNPTFPMDLAKETFAEAKANQKYWYGDFYPLMQCTTTPDQWIAYQFHRADLDEGIVLAFRRATCVYPVIAISLHALRPEGKYTVEFIGDDREPVVKQMTGAELSSEYELRLGKPGSSMVMRYKGE
jgi:alpha-galactosidase